MASVLSLPVAFALADDATEIKKLIPSAAAMSVNDFKLLSTLESAPTEKTVEEKSLTLMLLMIRINLNDDEKTLEQFK